MFFIAVAQVLWQLKFSIDLQWEKLNLAFIAISVQVFWKNSGMFVEWSSNQI